jgi:1,4-alpha-glucan branching enzyme
MTRATHSTVAPFISEYDLHLLREGKHYRSYEKLGAHLVSLEGVAGVQGA